MIHKLVLGKYGVPDGASKVATQPAAKSRRAEVVLVPLLDMLRYQNSQIARLWVPEDGTAEEEENSRQYQNEEDVAHNAFHAGRTLGQSITARKPRPARVDCYCAMYVRPFQLTRRPRITALTKMYSSSSAPSGYVSA